MADAGRKAQLGRQPALQLGREVTRARDSSAAQQSLRGQLLRSERQNTNHTNRHEPSRIRTKALVWIRAVRTAEHESHESTRIFTSPNSVFVRIRDNSCEFVSIRVLPFPSFKPPPRITAVASPGRPISELEVCAHGPP